MTKALAHEVAGRGITANCVAPGFIESDMTAGAAREPPAGGARHRAAGRLGTPDDIAACVVFLASDEAAYVTGQTIHVNGGMAMIRMTQLRLGRGPTLVTRRKVCYQTPLLPRRSNRTVPGKRGQATNF